MATHLNLQTHNQVTNHKIDLLHFSKSSHSPKRVFQNVQIIKPTSIRFTNTQENKSKKKQSVFSCSSFMGTDISYPLLPHHIEHTYYLSSTEKFNKKLDITNVFDENNIENTETNTSNVVELKDSLPENQVRDFETKLENEPKELVRKFLRSHYGSNNVGSSSLYLDPSVKSNLNNAVQDLIRFDHLNSIEKDIDLYGNGTWDVFYAPHITRISELFGVQFDPIRYCVNENQIESNVFYKSKLFGQGWLNASGKLSKFENNQVQILFDSFWWDTDSNLTKDPQGKGSFLNTLINGLGKVFFFPQFSIFPVLYFDSDLVVFQFTPLNSNIAARRIL